MAHRLGLLSRDRGIGRGQALGEIGLERLALVAFGGKLGAGFLGETLGLALGLGQRLLVGDAGFLGPGLHGGGLVQSRAIVSRRFSVMPLRRGRTRPDSRK